MPYEKGISSLNGPAAVRAANATLKRIDTRLMDHGERVAYIATEIARAGNLPLDMKLIFLLSSFHDIGAYKTDEINRMVEFETYDVKNHSIYGYLFIKHLTPLGEYAEGVLYHHTPWSELKHINTKYKDYAALIHLADRIDIASTLDFNLRIHSIKENAEEQFNDEYVKIFSESIDECELLAALVDGSYKDSNDELIDTFVITPAEALEYLKMVAYSIDFRSVHTVTHTINTVSIAECLAKHECLTEPEYECIYLGALLHDVGKIGIPLSILEYPGKLTNEQMIIMRTHVDQTESLLTGIVPDYILQISIRHHEKLDGSGYPRGLTGDKLDKLQRIVAVADITSALGSRRSYKEPFPKEKTISILTQMSEKQLDPEMCNFICTEYDKIVEETDTNRNVIIQTYQSIIKEYETLCLQMKL